MADLNLTQAEVDTLITVGKHRAKDERIDVPTADVRPVAWSQRAEVREELTA